MHPDDEVLAGGNMTTVVRRGATVRRQAGPWTPTVHRLLLHLRASGLTWVPAPSGVDDHGREVLSFLPGTVPHDPMPNWAWRDHVLISAADRLRQLHDATTGYVDPDAAWQLPSHEPAEVICHNDFVPYNMVFDEQQRLVGVIDWDTASPGPRVWDLAYLAYRVVPLAAPSNVDGLPSSVTERRRRLALLCDIYGASTPHVVERAAVDRLIDLAKFTEARAAAGATHVASHVATYRNDIAWLRGQLS